MSREAPIPSDIRAGPNIRVAVAAARFNGDIVDQLLAGCRQRLGELGLTPNRIVVHQVPGAFELPLAAQTLARTGRFAAVICLGAVIRGQTPHFDYVAGQCAAGVARVSLDENLPVIFGVLTTDTRKQALDRTGGSHGHVGRRAADAAVEMIAVFESIKRDTPAPRRRR
jgi:6,7-dimethyl-8-ribityllumazine synthase